MGKSQNGLPLPGPTSLKLRPDSGAVRNRPDGTVRSRPDAARSRPDTARNSTVERSERNKSHTNYMLITCSAPQFCHVQDEHGQVAQLSQRDRATP